MKKHICAAGMAACCILNLSAFAQTNEPSVTTSGDNGADWAPSLAGKWKMGFSSDYSAVAAGRVDFPGAKGESDAQSVNASLTAEIPVNDKWFVPLALSSHNIFPGAVTGAPIPYQIDTLGLNAGAGYRLNSEWTIAAAAGPRFYRIYDTDSGDIGVGGAIRATYLFRPNLTFAFGFAVDPDRDIPVLPGAGLKWDIRDDLTLSVMFPRSGLTYHIDHRLSLFAGFDGEFAVFRGEDNMGSKIGLPQYNNALGTYRDFHAGVGVEYRLVRGLTASVEGGYSFDREMDYQRIDQTVKFDSAPYVQVGFRYHF